MASNNIQNSHKSRDAGEDSEHIHQVVVRSSPVPQQYYAQTNQRKCWENLEVRKLTWRNLWQVEGSWISFIIQTVYDALQVAVSKAQEVLWQRQTNVDVAQVLPDWVAYAEALLPCLQSSFWGMGMRPGLLQAIRSLSETAERSSNWRKDPNWAPKWHIKVKKKSMGLYCPLICQVCV